MLAWVWDQILKAGLCIKFELRDALVVQGLLHLILGMVGLLSNKSNSF
jgi:hypothetical protein